MKPSEFEQLVCDHYRQKGYPHRQLPLRMIMASMYLQSVIERVIVKERNMRQA